MLVNSFGATPLMELYILFRRVQQRLAAKDILIERTGSDIIAPRWTWPALRSPFSILIRNCPICFITLRKRPF